MGDGRQGRMRRDIGAPDQRRDLYEGTLQVARTGQGPREQVASIGCLIKWKDAAPARASLLSFFA